MSSFIKDFKEFAMRGNVVDMAVGVVIGAAFGKIVSSLVDDIIMPLVGVLTGGMNFTDYKLIIKQEVTDAAGTVVEPLVSINWGTWIQTIVNFLIVAFCIFVMIRFMAKLHKQEKVEETTPTEPIAPEPTKEETLLTEIRDILKNDKR